MPNGPIIYNMWEGYCFDACGTFLASVIIMFCIFNSLRFLSKDSGCALYYVLV